MDVAAAHSSFESGSAKVSIKAGLARRVVSPMELAHLEPLVGSRS